MRVNRKIYDWYMEAFIHDDDAQKELFILAVMQSGYGAHLDYTNAIQDATDYGLDMGEFDEDIYYFINKNKLEFVAAVINNDIEIEEQPFIWQLRDSYCNGNIFISAEQPCEHVLTLNGRRWAGVYTRSEVYALLSKLENGFTIDMFKEVE